jgi:hypothetical protein
VVMNKKGFHKMQIYNCTINNWGGAPARYSYLCPKLKLINKKKRREKRKKEEKGRVLTHKGII